jgi:nucleoside-diphosphate-sugar epimerase
LKNILITGGAGSVGKELAVAFAQSGYNVSIFDIPVANFTGLEQFKIVKGDISNSKTVQEAVNNTDIVLHLAALLPPVSEADRTKTFMVNTEGTVNLVDAVKADGNKARMIFTSTVATYGDSTATNPPLRVDHPQQPNTLYSESKVKAERYILNSGIPYTILRVSGVVLPVLADPPEWPFTADQRVEFINRADVVTALFASVVQEQATNKILNLAGGKSWQMLGQQFVEQYFSILDIPPEDAIYSERPIYGDWYDTTESQHLLDYQRTSFQNFLELLDKAVLEALGD